MSMWRKVQQNRDEAPILFFLRKSRRNGRESAIVATLLECSEGRRDFAAAKNSSHHWPEADSINFSISFQTNSDFNYYTLAAPELN